MRKIAVLILFGLGIFGFTNAQQVVPTVVSPAGGSSAAGTIVLDWTLGEPVVESGTTDKVLYTQGFHQPMLSVEKVNDLPFDLLPEDAVRTVSQSQMEITIAPNPVRSTLNLNLATATDTPIDYRLMDASGRPVLSNTIAPGTSTTKIDVNALPPGFYLLWVFGPDEAPITAFKISKVH